MISDPDLQKLVDEYQSNGVDAPQSTPTMDAASAYNPDDYAEAQAIGRKNGINTNVVLPVIDDWRKKGKGIDPEKNPRTAQYYEEPENAILSQDDMDVLSNMETTLKKKPELTVDHLKKIFSSGSDRVTSNMGAGMFLLAETLSDSVDEVMTRLGVDPREDEDTRMKLFDYMKMVYGREVKKADKAYRPISSTESVEEKYKDTGLSVETAKEFGTLVAEQGAHSAPDMIAMMIPGVGLPSHIIGFSNEKGRINAKNSGEEYEFKHFMRALPAVIASDLLDKLTFKGLLGAGKADKDALIEVIKKGTTLAAAKYAATETGKAVGKDMAAESVQDGFLEPYAETTETPVPWDWAGNLERGAWGAAIAGPISLGISSPSAAFNVAAIRREQRDYRKQDELQRIISSESEQNKIDTVISLAQSSATGRRDLDRFQDYMRSVSEERVYIDQEAIQQASREGILPDSIRNRADGTEPVAVGLDEYARWGIEAPAFIQATRQHVKLRPESYTMAEIERGDGPMALRDLVRRAEKEGKIKAESEAIYNNIVSQLQETGRMPTFAARVGARLYPAYVTQYVARARDLGKDITPEQVFSDMGLSIVGPTDVAESQNPIFQKAKAMKEAGEDVEKIRMETGWLQENGRLRYDTDLLEFAQDSANKIESGASVGDIVSGGRFAENFPRLAKKRIEFTDGKSRSEVDAIYVNRSDNVSDVIKKVLEEDGVSAYQFAGENAITANTENLAKAVAMDAAGRSAISILEDTGWQKGLDGKWRFEISDDVARLSTDFERRGRWSLPDVMEHSRLFEAYPEFRTLIVNFVDPSEAEDYRGMYDEKNGTIIIKMGMTEEKTLSVLLHEVQHAIQSVEEFALGGSAEKSFTDYVKSRMQSLADAGDTVLSQWYEANAEAVNDYEKAAELFRNALIYEASERLIEQSNSKSPSGVFRNIRNNMQFLYDYRGNREAVDLQRRFYDIPKRGEKRNRFISEMAFDAAKFYRANLPKEHLEMFKNDPRTVKGMIKALERDASRKRVVITERSNVQNVVERLDEANKKVRYDSPYDIYKKLAGEAEARATQKRQNMDEFERRESLLRDSLDINPDDAIIVYGGLEIRLPERIGSISNEHLNEIPSTPLGDRAEIEVDGVMRPALNSKGQAIHWSEEGVRNFWKWFGKSKVVDAEGRPLVVYHGTSEKGLKDDEFKKSYLGYVTGVRSAKSGFFFTSSETVASGYGELANEKPVADLIEQSEKAERKGKYDIAADLMEKAEQLEKEMADNRPEPVVYPVYLRIEKPQEFDADGERFHDVSEDIHGAIDAAAKKKKDGVILGDLIDSAMYGHDDVSDHYIVFNPTQIKSVANVGSFSRETGNIYYQKSESGFFSQLQKAAKELKQEKGTPDQMLAMLKKAGAKDAEIEAVGLKEFLELAGKSITKAQIVEFVSNNGVQVETTVLGAEVEEKEDGFTVSDDYGRRIASFETEEEANSYTTENGGFVEPSARKQVRETRARNTTYTLPGGENHIELVLSIPNIEGWKQFDTTHYGDIADGKAVAWVRANDRTDADGKKVLFIEEIQSKRAQEGRSKGFNFVGYGKVPPAPFVEKTDAWVSLAMKRMITYAVENGYGRIAWTTGEQQADRYKLSKKVDEIEYWDSGILIYRKGKETVFKEEVSEDKLSNSIGSRLAEKLLKTKNTLITRHIPELGMSRKIRGRDLYVGGEGMKSFYDKIIPSIAKEVTKKMDGKVVELSIDGVGKQPGFDITDKMREQVETVGLPLFQKQGETQAVISLKNSGDRVIRLLNASNLSSFLHETGHLFLDMEAEFVRKYGTTADQEALLKWLGVNSFDELKVEHHEKFARTFEAYLREGKAPSNSLRETFARFKSWLVEIYKSLTDIPGQKLDPEITRIFDRLLASEQEIAEALDSAPYDQLFSSREDMGATEAEWQEYNKSERKVKVDAMASMERKIFEIVERMRKKDWQEEYSEKVDAITASVSDDRLHKAVEFLKGNKLNGEQVREVLGLPTAADAKAEADQVKAVAVTVPTEEQVAKALDDFQKNKILKAITKLDAYIPVSQFLNRFGYSSFKDFLDDMQNVKTPAEVYKKAYEDALAKEKDSRISKAVVFLKYNKLNGDQLRKRLGLPTKEQALFNKRRSDKVVRTTDSFLTAVARKGGINADWAINHMGVDWHDIYEETGGKRVKLASKAKRKGKLRQQWRVAPGVNVFVEEGGLRNDDLVEIAEENEYIPGKGQGQVYLSEVEDLVFDEIHGNPHYTQDGYIAVQEEMLEDDGAEIKEKDTPKQKLKKMALKVSRSYGNIDVDQFLDGFGFSSIDQFIAEYESFAPNEKASADFAKKKKEEYEKSNAYGAVQYAKAIKLKVDDVKKELGIKTDSDLKQEDEERKAEIAALSVTVPTEEQTKKGKLLSIAKKLGSIDSTLDVEQFAQGFGYKSFSEFVSEYMTYQPANKIAKAQAEREMGDKYGDILSKESIMEEVRDAVTNEEQSKRLLSELRAMTKKSKSRAIDTDMLKAQADEKIAATSYRDLLPNKYYQAMIRHAQASARFKALAEKATSPKEKADLLRKSTESKAMQLSMHYHYRAALESVDRIEFQSKSIKKASTRKWNPKQVSPEFIDNIVMLTKVFSLRNSPERTKKLNDLLTWYDSQVIAQKKLQAEGKPFIPFEWVSPELFAAFVARSENRLEDVKLRNLEDMTASDVQGLYDTYRHLRFLGGKVSEENGDEITKKREDAAAIVREVAQARGKKKIVEHERKWRLRDSILADLLYSERDLYGILGYLSRFTEEGPLADILRKVNDASYHEVEMKMDAAKEINRLMKPINFTLKPVWNVRKSITKEDGKPWTLSKRGIFMLALNSGNDSNIGAVLDGMNTNYPEEGAFTERDLYEMVSHLTDVELDAVNGIWAYKDNVLWPEHSAMQKRMTGVTAGKIQAKPFAIRGKRMTGGHFRLHYRWDSKDQGRTAIELDGLDTSRVAMSKSASMIERIGGGGRIVELDMAEHIAADLDNDIRDIAFQELSVELNAMFMGSENSLVKAISDHYGEKYYKNLVTTLERIVKPPRDKGNRWAPVSKYIRGNMTYAFLAGNVSNIVQNIASVANVYSEVGEKYATLGLLKFYSNPFSHIQEIDKEHPGMANRTALINREAREQLGQIEAVHPLWGAFKNYAMSPQAFFDSLVAYPCYVGAKMQFLDKNRDKYDGSPEGIEKRDKDASDYAMRMVEFSVGSGLAKNLGSMFSGSEGEKMFTVMGTYFNRMYNNNLTTWQKAASGNIHWAEAARKSGWSMLVGPWIASAIALRLFSHTEEEEEEGDAWLAENMLNESVAFLFANEIILRSVWGAISGFAPTVPAYTGVAATGKGVKEVVEAFSDDEFTGKDAGALIRSAGVIVPLPYANQIAKQLEGAAVEDRSFLKSMMIGGRKEE